MERSQLGSLSPGDAVVALRSFVRRYRDAFRPGELRGEDLDPSSAPPTGEPAPLDLVGRATRAFDALGGAVDRTLFANAPALEAGLLDRAGRDGGPVPRDAEAALDALRDSANRLADIAARTPLGDWNRAATIDGTTPVTAFELLTEAVATGRTYLDELERSLDALRRATQ